ncbi:RNA-guided endonuclease InsQ/TnpB family protein [Gloeobacter morelensis]|uniref:RNA-guided endonuclease InsQ/TnpB family protein n=1 Tax=Gloeobacter morelensis TaxID=2907343 RepID=UPI001E2A10DE|nr:transposase [Gloeobacter morelensis]UFP97212.1 transposase [Gloeobacter morelensis MG652769]
MNRTVRLLLRPTLEQEQALLGTLVRFTDCFNAVCEAGWQDRQKNGVELHKRTYRGLKDSQPGLVSDLIIQARVKATEALASAIALENKGKKVGQPKSKLCPARYNDHTYRLSWQASTVNMSSVAGRLAILFDAPACAAKYLGHPTATADLVHRKGRFWLHVVVDVPTPEVQPTADVVGVDLGIKRPAVTSNNKFLGERRWRNLEARTFKLKRALQSKGTKSAKRHLRKLSGKQLRRRRDHDHVLSRRIVQATPAGATIALENLTGIRGRAKQRNKGGHQRRLHCWSFAQLRTFIEYKAEETGIRVVLVDPRNTSKACNRCGHVHRSNRPSQSVFRCKSCGCELNADLNAARNIRLKHLASVGMSDAGAPSSTGVSSRSPLGSGASRLL